MKLKIIQKSLGKKRQNSFWYNGQIATMETDHGTYSLEACGDIRVMFDEGGDCYKNRQAVDEADNRNLTDKDLNKIGEFDGFSNNNWFEVVCIKEDNVDSAIGDVADTYNEGIEMLKQYVEEQVYKTKE